MSGLTTKQQNKIKALEQSGLGLKDIVAITGFERWAVADILSPRKDRRERDNRRELNRMRAARPLDRSVEDHERVLMANFPELFEGVEV